MPRRPHRLIGGRSVDRLINFSDAVVAVAVTVLVLPLVDIEGPTGDQTVWKVLADHSGELLAFLFTFYVVVVMWLVHNRILNQIVKYDSAILWLNTTWLVGIVLLPWFSAMYGEGQEDHPSVGVLYWIVLTVISLASSLMSGHLSHHPELLDPKAVRPTQAEQRRGQCRGAILGSYFLLIAVAWQIVPGVAAWMAFGIIPLSIWLRPAQAESKADAEASEHGSHTA